MDPKDGGAGKTSVDAFGVERTAEGTLVPDKYVPKSKDEGDKGAGDKGGAGGEGDKGKGGDENPDVAAVKKDLATAQAEITRLSGLGENLSKQRGIIETLEAKIKALEGGKKVDEIKPLYPDIKKVKDLSQEEQDAMTDAEKKLFDENAEIKERLNTEHVNREKAKLEEAAEGEKGAEEKKENAAKNAQTEAKKLAGDDVDMANAILAEFNQFAGNDTLDAKGLEERMAKAAKLVPTYKPAKEQNNQRGGAAGGGDGGGGDKFDSEKIIAEVEKGKGGNYQL